MQHKMIAGSFQLLCLALCFAFASLLTFPLDAAEEKTGATPLSGQHPADKNKKNLCLSMIVKNESRIIERCLDSTKNLVDCISICDTGSTDNTVEIIEDYLKKNNIPGKVHHHTWKNFGHNRTLSAHAAQADIKRARIFPPRYLPPVA